MTTPDQADWIATAALAEQDTTSQPLQQITKSLYQANNVDTSRAQSVILSMGDVAGPAGEFSEATFTWHTVDGVILGRDRRTFWSDTSIVMANLPWRVPVRGPLVDVAVASTAGVTSVTAWVVTSNRPAPEGGVGRGGQSGYNPLMAIAYGPIAANSSTTARMPAVDSQIIVYLNGQSNPCHYRILAAGRRPDGTLGSYAVGYWKSPVDTTVVIPIANLATSVELNNDDTVSRSLGANIWDGS